MKRRKVPYFCAMKAQRCDGLLLSSTLTDECVKMWRETIDLAESFEFRQKV